VRESAPKITPPSNSTAIIEVCWVFKIENNKEMSTIEKGSNRTKERITSEEVNHFSQVNDHPAFKADPLAAIREHLKNTVAAGK